MRIVFGLIGLLLLLVIAFFFTQNYFGFFGSKATASVKTHTFSIDVAKTPKEKQVGLSGKTSIAADYGMYFPFEKADYYAFWMKDMKTPIDIIFLRDNKIISIFPNVQPPKSENEKLPLYQPEEPADAVLEIAAGQSQKYGLKKGDTITFKNLPK